MCGYFADPAKWKHWFHKRTQTQKIRKLRIPIGNNKMYLPMHRIRQGITVQMSGKCKARTEDERRLVFKNELKNCKKMCFFVVLCNNFLADNISITRICKLLPYIPTSADLFICISQCHHESLLTPQHHTRIVLTNLE